MIGIRDFGWRLGNQMFQIAAAVGLATMYGDEVAFPQWDYAKYFNGDFTPKEMTPSVVYQQPGFHYTPIDYQPDMAIAGYFQSEKFFGNCKKKIREIFTLKETTNKPVTNGRRTIAIHVRRGDYLKYPDHHPIASLEYYQKAIELFPRDVQLMIFSDDIAWCTQQKVFSQFENFDSGYIGFSNGNEIDDFTLMTQCDDFIIGNSSYSWWGAWLGNKANKRVIAPKNWFGPAYAHFNTKDLYCKDWIVL